MRNDAKRKDGIARDILDARAHGPAMKKTLLVVVLILGVEGSRAMAFDVATEDPPSREATARREEMLLRRDAEWADLATKGKDIDKIVSYWTDDARGTRELPTRPRTLRDRIGRSADAGIVGNDIRTILTA